MKGAAAILAQKLVPNQTRVPKTLMAKNVVTLITSWASWSGGQPPHSSNDEGPSSNPPSRIQVRSGFVLVNDLMSKTGLHLVGHAHAILAIPLLVRSVQSSRMGPSQAPWWETTRKRMALQSLFFLISKPWMANLFHGNEGKKKKVFRLFLELWMVNGSNPNPPSRIQVCSSFVLVNDLMSKTGFHLVGYAHAILAVPLLVRSVQSSRIGPSQVPWWETTRKRMAMQSLFLLISKPWMANLFCLVRSPQDRCSQAGLAPLKCRGGRPNGNEGKKKKVFRFLELGWQTSSSSNEKSAMTWEDGVGFMIHF